ncbi:MAG: PQQ-dependent sugar dehydrogenase [Saprospiraceae bacterium]|nr:PQQ-dependent sugar dehydrogenase [Saprospiraceae bacterium]
MRRQLQILSLLSLFILGSATLLLPPPGAIGPYLNEVFPDSPPGKGNLYQLEDPMPNLEIPSPIKLISIPNQIPFFVLSKGGEVYLVDPDVQSKRLVLDIKDRTFKLGDAGSIGMALHPDFGNALKPDRQELFVFYKTKPNIEEFSNKGFNRLSKFKWNMDSNLFDPDTEEILIQQYDRSEWHDGGGMFFGSDGFLYLSLGDEGKEQYQIASTQRLDGGLFGGVIRIDINNDPTKSHPIRRQPIANAAPDDNWGQTFSRGYGIPNDNPWLDPNGSMLEEFVALGIRSPFSMHLDIPTGDIWLADVGSDKREEINIFSIGDNMQWPYMEGTVPSEIHQKPTPYYGNEKEVYYEYERDIGTCIIGGGVYRNSYFSELNEKYLFADFTANKIMALSKTGSNNEPEFEVLLDNLIAQPVNLPVKPRISGIHLQDDGNIFVTIYGESAISPSKIFQLKRITEVEDPPAKLSELGVFKNLQSLEVEEGILPYEVNSPLWSDGAHKKRWMALPNDGKFDSKEEKINFSNTDTWSFPEGTVFIKHFEMPTSLTDNSELIKLETRFFVVGKGKKGYGLTYKWNDEGTEAFLLGGGSSRSFEIFEDGEYAYTQEWDFPSRDQCISCHTDNADYVLGVNTHQLNKKVAYDFNNEELNQLDYLNQQGIFSTDIGFSGFHPKSYAITDETVDLEQKIRSYLDANCSSCHREGGIPDINLDFQYFKNKDLRQYIDFPVASHASTSTYVVEEGNHESSEIWIRDNSTEDNKMPPIGRNFVDQVYVDSLAYWIDNLKENPSTSYHELLVFPNPTTGWIGLQINNTWSPPYTIDISTMSGRNIWQSTTKNNFEYYDLTDYATGTYLITVRSGTNMETRKFVIQ